MSGFYEFNHVNIKHKNDFEPFTESDLMVRSSVVVLGNDEIPDKQHLRTLITLDIVWSKISINENAFTNDAFPAE